MLRHPNGLPGVTVEPISLALIDVSPTFTYPSGDSAQYLDLVFRCLHVSGDAHVGDDESTAIAWFSPHHLPALDVLPTTAGLSSETRKKPFSP
jgi:8-oxo-dGTP pyrophosphatase MutT (NUDIX family)